MVVEYGQRIIMMVKEQHLVLVYHLKCKARYIASFNIITMVAIKQIIAYFKELIY